MCGKIMTVLLIFVVLNCSMARYNGRLHCIVGVLPTCYKRKAATYFYPPGGTGPTRAWKKDTYTGQMLYTDEVIIFVPCATHGHKMIHEQMKHVSNMRK